MKRLKGTDKRPRREAEGYDDVYTFGVLAAEGFLPGYGLKVGAVLGTAEIPFWRSGAKEFVLPRPSKGEGFYPSQTETLKVVDDLLRSADSAARDLGAKALQSMCMTSNFSSAYDFEFGARSRNYGYHPRTGKDVSDWFAAVLKFAEPFALSDSPLRMHCRLRFSWQNTCVRFPQLQRKTARF